MRGHINRFVYSKRIIGAGYWYNTKGYISMVCIGLQCSFLRALCSFNLCAGRCLRVGSGAQLWLLKLLGKETATADAPRWKHADSQRYPTVASKTTLRTPGDPVWYRQVLRKFCQRHQLPLKVQWPKLARRGLWVCLCYSVHVHPRSSTWPPLRLEGLYIYIFIFIVYIYIYTIFHVIGTKP